MNKRKLDINEIKKNIVRGRKYRTVDTNCEVVSSYFKHKQIQHHHVFKTQFFGFIHDLLQQLNSAQLIYKLQNNITDTLRPIQPTSNAIKIHNPFLKYLSKEYPIQEIVECFYVKKEEPTSKLILGITQKKLMIFQKNLKKIYSQFCFCVGDKTIVQDFEMKSFYQSFKNQWGKSQEKGRMLQSQKLQKLICRSLYFLGIIIENNILNQISVQEKKKKQEAVQFEIKSEKKKKVKGITHKVLSSAISTENMSHREEIIMPSMKSQNMNRTGKTDIKLLEKVDIRQLKMKLECENEKANDNSQFEIDLLSNDVENILIEQAFKIQKFKDFCSKNQVYANMNQMHPYQMYQQSYFNYQQPYYHSNYSDEGMEVSQGRRGLGLSNLVETRKTQSRLGNKY